MDPNQRSPSATGPFLRPSGGNGVSLPAKPSRFTTSRWNVKRSRLVALASQGGAGPSETTAQRNRNQAPPHARRQHCMAASLFAGRGDGPSPGQLRISNAWIFEERQTAGRLYGLDANPGSRSARAVAAGGGFGAFEPLGPVRADERHGAVAKLCQDDRSRYFRRCDIRINREDESIAGGSCWQRRGCSGRGPTCHQNQTHENSKHCDGTHGNLLSFRFGRFARNDPASDEGQDGCSWGRGGGPRAFRGILTSMGVTS